MNAKTRQRRRFLLLLIVVCGSVLLAITLFKPTIHHAVREVTLPLKHEAIIRQQGHDKGVDPVLIAAVIYAESGFRPRTSSAGAKGLMQITPTTAQEIAQRSGATNFMIQDLATPQVNIAYGTFYLKYLLRHYGGNQRLALAAYNAGQGKVDSWIVQSRQRNQKLTISRIPYLETREYVRRVLDAKERYRETYGNEL